MIFDYGENKYRLLINHRFLFSLVYDQQCYDIQKKHCSDTNRGFRFTLEQNPKKRKKKGMVLQREASELDKAYQLLALF